MYVDSFGFQWNVHRRTQLDSFSGKTVSRDRLFAVTGWPQNMTGQCILEAGSGAGRFTEILLSTGAEVTSFDYSSAVLANHANNGGAPNLSLFRGDIFNLPLRPAAFDKVLCLGVLQHTPDPQRAFMNLVQFVRPGGEIVIDVYKRSLSTMLSWKYLLRPLTRRMDQRQLYDWIVWSVDRMLPAAVYLRRHWGRFGAKLLPILEYSYLGLSQQQNREWAILDTFDMYSPAHDHPQTLDAVRDWFAEARLSGVDVRYGPNGIVGRGIRQ